MPDLMVSSSVTLDTFRAWLTTVWDLSPTRTKVVVDAVDHSKLVDDYAAIAHFLTDRKRVVTYLKPLDEAIKAELDAAGRETVKGRVEAIRVASPAQRDALYKRGNSAVHLATQANPSSTLTANQVPDRDKIIKTDKLLSGILDRFETLHGFNNATGALRKLHTTAETAGDGTNAVAFGADQVPTGGWQPYNPEGKEAKDLRTVAVPSGPPTLTGILKKSFNPVLLRNGYHWKDPGADAKVHGEFTHRLQWYAVVQASLASALKLTNQPVQIFKSMGYLFATGSNEYLPSTKAVVYLWELLFDVFAFDQKGTNPGKPYGDTFNCPNVLQSYLSGAPMGPGPHDLFYLKILMRARFLKRDLEAPTKTAEAIGTGTKQTKFGITSPEDGGREGQIWWPLR
jgi:hypothetical protein